MQTFPTWLKRIIEGCCPDDRVDVLGDFEEWYDELIQEKGTFRANLIMLLHGVSMLKLKAITRSKKNSTRIMLSLHVKIAKRNLIKNKLYTSINLLGLAVGLTVCTLITLFILDELSYDAHFAGVENVYRVAGEYDHGGDTRTASTYTPYLLMPAMQNNLDPSVTYTRMDFMQLYVTIGEQSFWEDYSVAVDSNFFEVFTPQFIAGDPRTALDDPTSVVIDRSNAIKFFEGEEALGNTLEIGGTSYLVTGIIEDLPNNTHFEAHLFFPIASIVDSYPYWLTDTWGGVSHRLYFKTPSNYNVAHLETSLEEFIADYTENEVPPRYFFQPVKDIHLSSNLRDEIQTNGNYRTLYIFIATAIVILLLACINFINLSIAGSIERLKEIGVKKVMGATRKSQIFQFQFESLLVGSLASLLSVLFVKLALPIFMEVTGKVITLGWQEDVTILASCIALVVLISLITGSFLALFLLKVTTQNALAGTMVSNKKSRFQPRNVMVGVQFFLAGILISSTLVILQQMNFMKNKDLGIDSEQLVVVPFQSEEGFQNYEVVKNELMKHASFVDITASTNSLTGRVGGWRQYRRTDDAEDINIPTVVVAHNYFETIGAELADGRPFSEEFTSDYREAYVVNEAAAAFLELDNPVNEKLIGSAFTGSEWSRKNARIIGVVKDFHFASLHDKIRPVVFSLSSEITMPLGSMLIRIRPENMDESITQLQEVWRSMNADTPFRYQFVDEALQEHYQQEARFLEVFSSFTTLSIFIGCLGLFGLTAFIMKKRTKEIGIRKVLGANQLGLFKVLSSSFIRLVLIASLLGIPITLWLMGSWLENFEYRITIGWWVFILTALGSLLAAGVSITFHSLKVARVNPVETIKHE